MVLMAAITIVLSERLIDDFFRFQLCGCARRIMILIVYAFRNGFVSIKFEYGFIFISVIQKKMGFPMTNYMFYLVLILIIYRIIAINICSELFLYLSFTLI